MASATDLVRALAHGGRLELLATLNPRIWEVVGGGPLGRVASELNPQPLPPVAAGQELSWALARSIIIIAGRDPGEARQAYFDEIEDWCGTGWPRRWPFPWPDPREDLRTELLLGGAIGTATLATHYPAGEMRGVFEKASEMLTEAALG